MQVSDSVSISFSRQKKIFLELIDLISTVSRVIDSASNGRITKHKGTDPNSIFHLKTLQILRTIETYNFDLLF